MPQNKGRASIKDIARACGVGTTTVSRVINGRGEVSAETEARVQAAIRELGYVPSAAARRMGSGRAHEPAPTQTVAIVTRPEGVFTLAYSELLAALSRSAAGVGYRVVLETVTGSPMAQGYDGMIVLAGAEAACDDGTPCVTVDWLSDDPLVPGVLPDYESGAYRATATALRRGCRNPLLLTGRASEHERIFEAMLYRGFARALEEAGMAPAEHLFGEVVRSKEGGYRAAYDALQQADRPDLIFVNDDGAVGVYRAAAELGLSIPRDLSVLGCDGISLGDFLVPQLATIRISPARVAEEALRRLIPAVNGSRGPAPNQLLSPTEFTPAGSIRPVERGRQLMTEEPEP